MENNKDKASGIVSGIISNLVIVKVEIPVMQNEICYIINNNIKLMAEVIKIENKYAYVQCFESTTGLRPVDEVIFTGHMLEAKLGPGILSKNYDGLQNNLETMEGVFLKKGDYTDALEEDSIWEFTPIAKEGDTVISGDWLGEVPENWMNHKIMVPFKFEGSYTVKSIAQKGEYNLSDTIAILEDEDKNTYDITMVQYWPIKKPIKSYINKPRPFKLLETGIRIFDTLNPMTEGGTGFIPGPFGCGKTVLQHNISKQADADMVVLAACGERANEVVEIFKEFPELIDPRTGRKLKERTTIIANTSNMPVASREASVYTAMTISEYYRSMGLKVILLADSTSRWAQALREMSNRLEELPGPEAFPMDLSSIISNFYSRAGFVYLNNGKTGSITFIGTVSPAGGNLKEPVTESTKKVARCFYALSQDRADKKRYPSINPIDSYSKYLEYPELQDYIKDNIGKTWVNDVFYLKDILRHGSEAFEQINILGDDGVTMDVHDKFWKSEVVDFIILQQDAFDKIDCSASIERQKSLMEIVISICKANYEFNSFEEISKYFKRIINTLKQLNYSEFKSEKYNAFENELNAIISEKIKESNNVSEN